MTETDKQIQDLRRANEILIQYIDQILEEIKWQQALVTEIREQANRMIKEAER